MQWQAVDVPLLERLDRARRASIAAGDLAPTLACAKTVEGRLGARGRGPWPLSASMSYGKRRAELLKRARVLRKMNAPTHVRLETEWAIDPLRTLARNRLAQKAEHKFDDTFAMCVDWSLDLAIPASYAMGSAFDAIKWIALPHTRRWWCLSDEPPADRPVDTVDHTRETELVYGRTPLRVDGEIVWGVPTELTQYGAGDKCFTPPEAVAEVLDFWQEVRARPKPSVEEWVRTAPFCVSPFNCICYAPLNEAIIENSRSSARKRYASSMHAANGRMNALVRFLSRCVRREWGLLHEWYLEH